MAKIILESKWSESTVAIPLAFILIKKSTIAISQLAKLIKTGKNDEMMVEEAHRTLFFKLATVTTF
jgi:hypothetical protein